MVLLSSSENINKLRSLVEDLTIRDADVFELAEILKLTLEHTTDGYWDWNMVTNYEYLSLGLKKQLGYTDEDMLNNHYSLKSIILEEDLKKMDTELSKHIKSKGEECFKVITRFKHKDGHIVKILCRGCVVKWDENGNPIRMVGTHIDITDL